jgi:hypothetical protein
MVGRNEERDRKVLEAIIRHRPRFVILSPLRRPLVPYTHVFREYFPLNPVVWERKQFPDEPQ